MRGTRVFILLAAICAAACGGGGEEASGAECPDGSTLTYDSFGREFMTDYCTSCHDSALSGTLRNDAPSAYNFDTIEGIRDASDEIDGEAAAGPEHINTAMPPEDPRPSEADRYRLGEWLACGAP